MPWLPRQRINKKPATTYTNWGDTGFYQSKEWKITRAKKKALNPCCEICLRTKGIYRPMYFVDHIIPIKDGGAPFDLENLQSLCKPHNYSKTGQEAAKKKQERLKTPQNPENKGGRGINSFKK